MQPLPERKKLVRKGTCFFCKTNQGCNRKWKKYRTRKDKRHQNIIINK